MTEPTLTETIFFAALDLATDALRAAYLDEACDGDELMRRRIERLLDAYPQTGEFLERPLELAASVKELAAKDAGISSWDALGSLDFLAPSQRNDALGRIGHYEVLEVVGRGGMGIVLRAFDEKLQRIVAIKALAPALAVSGDNRQRFVREAQAAAAVTHDNVIAIHAVEDAGPVPYLVMQFIDGLTLQEKLDRHGQLPLNEILRIGLQMAAGLAAAHAQGLVHRDVKPANILLENGIERVKITDFGLAHAVDDASLAESGLIAGTPAFMSPEQASGAHVDPRSDLFSLGSVLCALCTGRAPFQADTTRALLQQVRDAPPPAIREANAGVPEALCRLIERLHAKAPAGRPASAAEVADVLARLLAEQNRGDSREPSRDPAPQGPVRHAGPTGRRWLWTTAAMILVLAGLGVGEASGVTDVRGAVIRLLWPEGTLVIEVDDPELSVTVDGTDVVITGAGAKEIRLTPGQYNVEASKDGTVVRQELVTVTSDGRQVVRISREAEPGGHVSNVDRSKSSGPPAKTNTLGMKFQLIPAGKFTMGSGPQEIDRCLELAGHDEARKERLRAEGPEHEVQITRPFYLSALKVTVGQFRQFIEANPTYNVGDERWKAPGFFQSDNHPVVWVSWNNAVDFCLWLSEKEGKTYRLPTEAEWEYSCRAGNSQTRYCYGDDEEQLSRYAWYGRNSEGRTHPVGRLKPNAWGLYDMHGHSWEWCKDYYDPHYYRSSPVKDPIGPFTGSDRVNRGGGYELPAAFCRPAVRSHVIAEFRASNLGFRVLLVAPPGGDRPVIEAKDQRLND